MSTRAHDTLRPLSITVDYTDAPLASVLIACGQTRVLCTCSEESRVPPFRDASGGGWLTAEYSMLPGATPRRVRRAASRGRPDGRSTEIQRLIGRSLRAAVDLDALGPRSLWIDCDVLQADGGTRTAAITGGWVAARIAIGRILARGEASEAAIRPGISAISVGLKDGQPILDLDYVLDSSADVDMNVVMDHAGNFVEVQGTAEGATFRRQQLDQLLDLAAKGCRELAVMQNAAVAEALG